MSFGRKRKAPRSGLRRFGHKRGTTDQRRCAMAMQQFRWWLDSSASGRMSIWSESDRRKALEEMKAAKQDFPGCVSERYWKLVENRIRNLPLDDPERYDRG